MFCIPTREKWKGMRYFPIGHSLIDVADVKNAELHPTAEIEHGLIKTAPKAWYYGLIVPVAFSEAQAESIGGNGLMVSARLHVRSGKAGVAIIRKDESVIEQVPVAVGDGSRWVRFCVVKPEELDRIVVRNWDKDAPSQFELLEISIHEAIRGIRSKDLATARWADLERLYARYFELSITDYCNLDCPFCSQSTQLSSRSKSYMSLEQIRRFSKLIRPGEFDILKISGGEPTLHPEFGAICEELPSLFRIPRKELASNGARLDLFADKLGVFSEIEVSRYPGRNDEEFKRVESLNLSNITLYRKNDYEELDNVNLEQNIDRIKIFENCQFAEVKKVIGERIYACPCIYGQLPIKGIPEEKVSVPFDENWREALSSLEMEPICRRCFNLIEAPILIKRG